MQKVHQGEKITIKASTWNSFIDAANFAKDSKLNNWGKPLKSGVSAGIVLVKNMEAQARDRFTALVITGICISPDANEDEFLSCVPVFEGSKMTEARADKPYVILMEPIASQAIGRAMILGVTPAKVVVNDSEDGFAVPRPGSQTGELESSSTGVARILWKGTGSGAQWCIVQLGGAGSGSGGELINHAKSAKFAKFLKPPNTRNTRNHCAPRDHENCVGDESRRSAIESLSSACGITLRVAAASVIASPLRVSSLAADTKRRERGDTKSHEMWGTGNWEEG